MYYHWLGPVVGSHYKIFSSNSAFIYWYISILHNRLIFPSSTNIIFLPVNLHYYSIQAALESRQILRIVKLYSRVGQNAWCNISVHFSRSPYTMRCAFGTRAGVPFIVGKLITKRFHEYFVRTDRRRLRRVGGEQNTLTTRQLGLVEQVKEYEYEYEMKIIYLKPTTYGLKIRL